MGPLNLLLILSVYFLVLLGISKVIERNSDNASFFTGNKNSPWYLVAFGMIGASLSGVTFLSVPGAVVSGQFAYFQMVLGFTVGYIVIALVLLPLYYRLNVTSIYSYLETRYGRNAQLVGSFFFMLSRVIGASLRMYLVVLVLQHFVFDQLFDTLNIQFSNPEIKNFIYLSVTIAISLALIWVYTSKAGIKTIVYTDTLQTFFMLVALGCTIYYILDFYAFDIEFIHNGLTEMNLTQIFFTDDLLAGNTFWKQFLGGAVIAIAMTGLDQDMMQKNLTCPNVKEAQKNVYAFSVVLIVVNALFLVMGALLVFYASRQNIVLPDRTDLVFPTLALQHFPSYIGIVFFIGLIAAAYSSADSALTSLTTSFCFDIMRWKEEKLHSNKTKVHIGFTILLFFVILTFCLWNSRDAIFVLFKLAGYTYGPLLGLFFFGIITTYKLNDKFIPVICVVSPFVSYGLNLLSLNLFGYVFGTELLLLNGVITFGLLSLIKKV